MKILLTLYVAVFSFNSWATGMLEYPAPETISVWQKYLPALGDGKTDLEKLPLQGKAKFSPFKTRKLIINSNLSNVAYEKSQTLISIFKLDKLLTIVELSGSKSVEANWINEELIHIQNWPGRCIQLDSIFNVVKNEFVYMAGLNHCGV